MDGFSVSLLFFFFLSFRTKGSNLGELNGPRSLADLSTGEIVVADMDNNRIQIFE